VSLRIKQRHPTNLALNPARYSNFAPQLDHRRDANYTLRSIIGQPA